MVGRNKVGSGPRSQYWFIIIGGGETNTQSVRGQSEALLPGERIVFPKQTWTPDKDGADRVSQVEKMAAA